MTYKSLMVAFVFFCFGVTQANSTYNTAKTLTIQHATVIKSGDNTCVISPGGAHCIIFLKRIKEV
jgi:hypothetical protein